MINIYVKKLNLIILNLFLSEKKILFITGSQGYIAKNVAKKLQKKTSMFMVLVEVNG